MIKTNGNMLMDSETLKKMAGVSMNDSTGGYALSLTTAGTGVNIDSNTTPILEGVSASQISSGDKSISIEDGPSEVPAGKKLVLGVFGISDGSVKFKTGMYVDNDDNHVACFPDYDPQDYVALGYVLIQNGTSSDKTLGSDDISSVSDITNTVKDVRKIMPGQEID